MKVRIVFKDGGFVLKNQAEWADSSNVGYLIAHDIFEHCPSDTGTVEHELMAIGAAIAVRGHTFANFTTGQNCASVIARDLENILNCDPILSTTAPPLDDELEHFDNDIQAAVRQFRRNLNNGFYMSDDEVVENARRSDDIIAWMRKGVVRLCKRFGDRGVDWVTYLFDAVSDHVNELLKRNHSEGAEYVLDIDTDRVYVESHPIWDY